MAITLIVNPGSTSRKYALYRDAMALLSVVVEQTGDGVVSCTTEVNGVSAQEPWNEGTLDTALASTLAWATARGLIAGANAITKVVVRVVAPGEQFMAHQQLTRAYYEALAQQAYLVPVHIPIVLKEVRTIWELLPKAQCLAISDSAFHHTMLPEERVQSLGEATIQNFGYHGLSAASISRRLEGVFQGVPARTVVLHVGGGVSVMGLREGKSIATSMGFTPASGIIMGTRGGDVGADALIAYMRLHDLTPTMALDRLYREAGFKALAGVSDLRLLLERAAKHDERAKRALAAFVNQVAGAFAARVVTLGGVDAVVLTATALVRNTSLREQLLAPLQLFGIAIDQDKNHALVGKEGRIEKTGMIPIMVMKTDEMGEMARIAAEL